MAIPGNMLSSTTEMIDPNTSGWTNHRNAALALGSGGRSGPGCLMVTSKAAGLVEVRTVSSYPVQQGELYQVFADAAATAVPEHIGIRWLDAAGAQISVTWGLNTATVSASWHRIGVAGRAPAGTARAQVLIGADATAAGQIIYAENVYLGLPVRTTGNLFSFGTESSEVDASGWAAEVNATVGRVAPAVQWPVAWYYAGGHVLSVTAVAAGNMAASCIERAAVTPGTEYGAYAYLSPPVLASQAWIEIRYFDSNNNQISVSRGPLAAVGDGWQRQRVSAVAPAAAATCSVAVGIDAASAGQVLRVEQAVVHVVTPARAGNKLTYESSSFEQGTGGWTVASGAATLARTTPWGATYYDASYALRATSVTATTSVIRSPIVDTPVAGGLPWRTEVFGIVTAGSWTVTRSVRWFNAAGTLLGTTSGAAVAVPGGGWWQLLTSYNAPVGAARAQVEFTLQATAANSSLALDRVSLWQAGLLSAVEAHDDDAYVTLTLRELPEGDLVSVYRVGADGARTLVRGPVGLWDRQPITSDFLVVEDYEAPLGIPISYYVETRAASDGHLTSYRETATVTLTPGDPNRCWLKDPANPQRSMRLLVKTAPEWKRPITQSEYRVRGRPNAVIHSDVRGGLEGDLVCWTLTEDERRSLTLLLSSGNTLFWQTAPGSGEDDLYVNVGEVALPRVVPLRTEQMREWTLPLTEADMPVAAGINGTSGRTWQDGLAENATWDVGQGRFATWEALFLNTPVGG